MDNKQGWLGKLLPSLSGIVLSLWGSSIVAAITTGVVVAVGWLGETDAATLIVLGILTFVAIMVGVNQLEQWQARNQRNLYKRSNGEIEATLWQWLRKKSFKLGDTLSFRDAHLQFQAIDPEGRIILVARLKSQAGLLRITAAFKPGVFERLPEPIRQNTIYNIGIEMARSGLIFGEKPVRVSEELPLDYTLNEFDFIEAVKRVRQGCVLVGFHVQLAEAIAKEQGKVLMQPPSELTPDKADSSRLPTL